MSAEKEVTCYWCLKAIAPLESFVRCQCTLDSCGVSLYHVECAQDYAQRARGVSKTGGARWHHTVRESIQKHVDKAMEILSCPIGHNPKQGYPDKGSECKGRIAVVEVIDPLKARPPDKVTRPAAAADATPFVSRKQRKAAAAVAAAAAGSGAKPLVKAGNATAPIATTKAPKKKPHNEVCAIDERFQMCRWVSRGMPCAKRKACPFAHSQPELEERIILARQPKGEAKGCPQSPDGAQAKRLTPQPPNGTKSQWTNPKRGPGPARPASSHWGVLGEGAAEEDEQGTEEEEGEEEHAWEETLSGGDVESSSTEWPGGPAPNLSGLGLGEGSRPLAPAHDCPATSPPPLPVGGGGGGAEQPAAGARWQLGGAALEAMRRFKRSSELEGLRFRVKMLENMGFQARRAEDALLITGGSVEAAAELLLQHQPLPSSTSDPSSPAYCDVSADVDLVMAACLARGVSAAAASEAVERSAGDCLAAMAALGVLPGAGEEEQGEEQGQQQQCKQYASRPSMPGTAASAGVAAGHAVAQQYLSTAPQPLPFLSAAPPSPVAPAPAAVAPAPLLVASAPTVVSPPLSAPLQEIQVQLLSGQQQGRHQNHHGAAGGKLEHYAAVRAALPVPQPMLAAAPPGGDEFDDLLGTLMG